MHQIDFTALWNWFGQSGRDHAPVDSERAFIVTEGLTPIGHSFVARKGRRTYYVALQGAVVEPAWAFAALLDEPLAAFDAFDFDGPGLGDLTE